MKYVFSVVIPIYNVDKYLEETILSVINQTIGFEKNIQIILVNDGSTDKSEKICLKYQKSYPDNIKYIYQKNKGVSEARNTGMKYIEGKYVNFLDGDDVWDLDVFEKVYNFFEANENEIDIVACRIKFFEARNEFHKLDYKFEETKIIDIRENYEYIQLSSASTFIKAQEIKKYAFDTRLKYFEDATLIGQLLMNKSKYGVLSDAIYNYRKRIAKTSALQIRENNKKWYVETETINYGYKLLIQKSIEKYGKILPYYQYQIMYDIQWRINMDISRCLSKTAREEYINAISEILKQIDDNIIMEQKFLKKEYKVLALCLKYNKDVRKGFSYKDSNIYFNDIRIFNIKNKNILKITNINITRKQTIIIEGIINCFLSQQDCKFFVKNIKDKRFYIEKCDIIHERPSIVGELDNLKKFKIELPINSDNMELKLVVDYKSNLKKLNIVLDNELNLVFPKRNLKVNIESTKIVISNLNRR